MSESDPEVGEEAGNCMTLRERQKKRGGFIESRSRS